MNLPETSEVFGFFFCFQSLLNAQAGPDKQPAGAVKHVSSRLSQWSQHFWLTFSAANSFNELKIIYNTILDTYFNGLNVIAVKLQHLFLIP